MTTAANIQLHNLETPLSVYLTHDGNPEAILRLLAEFYELSESARTFTNLRDLYQSEYRMNPYQAGPTLAHGQASYATWTYTVSRSDYLSCCNQRQANTAEPGNPFDYLHLLCDSYVESVRTSMKASLDTLLRHGLQLMLSIGDSAAYHFDAMAVTYLDIQQLSLPERAQHQADPSPLLVAKAHERRLQGWPDAHALAVRRTPQGYQVHTSYAWYKAGLLAGVTSIPCLIY